MSTTLSKGYKIPANSERGWWQILIDNWTRMNGHSHDGSNSEILSIAVLNKQTSDIAAASWGAATDGIYTQTITMPSGITFPKVVVRVYATVAGIVTSEIFPEIARVTDTTLTISVNDNTLNLKVVYA